VEAVAKHADVVVVSSARQENASSLPHVHAVLPAVSLHPAVQLSTYATVRKCCRGCDVLHSLVEPLAPATALAAHVSRIPFIMTLHGTYAVPSSRWSWQGMLMRFAYRTARLTTTGSLQTEQKVRACVPLGECRFIPNGVDPEAFHELPGVQREDVILTSGALKSRKGADVVVRALGLLKDEFPHLTYAIVGSVDDEKFVSALRRLVDALGLANRVRFLGRVSDAELLRLYNICRVFVLAARTVQDQFEGFPMVFYEANACGAPVITTRGFGSEYAIKDGKNGFLVDQDSPEQVADALRRLLRDATLETRLRRGALEEAAAHTWAAIAVHHLLSLYRDACTT